MNYLPSIDLDVAERLRADAEFRQAYFLAESSGMIARQLIGLRKRRGLSQTEIAKQLDTHQPAISRVESADYRNWSFNTLRRLAEAMDADWFESSTGMLLGSSFSSRLAAPWKVVHNAAVVESLRKLQERNRYCAWEIHNVFPAHLASI